MSERNRTEDESTGPPGSSPAERVASRTTTGVAPGRVNLIGEHLDYNGGRCLPVALSRTTSATVTLRADDLLRVRSGARCWTGSIDELGQVSDPDRWVLYVAGVLVALGVHRGMDIDISSNVPAGAGLSSSAALECSVAVAVDAALGLGRSRQELTDACVRAETETVGAPTGGLDQAIAMYAEPGHALLVDFASGSREQVPFDPGSHGCRLLVIDTRVSHELTDGGYGSRRDECDRAAAILGVEHLAASTAWDDLPAPLNRRARHVVTEVRRVGEFVEALRGDDWARLGPLMDASHSSLRDDFEVSCEELDVAVATACGAGASGARMTGGGFGGSAIALVPVGDVDRVRQAVSAAFSERGWQAPAYLLAEPGPGADARLPA